MGEAVHQIQCYAPARRVHWALVHESWVALGLGAEPQPEFASASRFHNLDLHPLHPMTLTCGCACLQSETEWQHYLRQCLETIAKIAELMPEEVFRVVVSKPANQLLICVTHPHFIIPPVSC